jgi:hypothetical protein
VRYFSVNFHLFVNNNKSYKTIKHRPSFDGTESTFSRDFSDWHYMPFLERIVTCVVQLGRISVMIILRDISLERAHQTASNDFFKNL